MIDTLDKIKAEITHRHLSINEKSEFDNGRAYAYEEVIDIIDKYRAESEESTDKRKIDITTGYDMERVYMEVEDE
jgi:hypothetical protein